MSIDLQSDPNRFESNRTGGGGRHSKASKSEFLKWRVAVRVSLWVRLKVQSRVHNFQRSFRSDLRCRKSSIGGNSRLQRRMKRGAGI